MIGRNYPPMPFPPVKPMPMPPKDYMQRFPLNEAFKKGTLFVWLYDPYYKKVTM